MQRRRLGYTLIELVVGLGAASVLMAGMASTVFMAARSLDHGGAKAVQTKQAHDAFDDVAMDLAHATTFTERAAHAVTFRVPDRDGNETPETFRYWWSGTAGDPLMVTYNGGTSATLADGARAFNLTYLTRSVTGTGFVKGMIQDPSLVAWWKLNETSGTTANDETTHALHASLFNNPTWTAGHSGNGLRFNGTSQYGRAPHNALLSITDQLTLTAWIWANSGSLSGFRFILRKGTNSTNINYGMGTYDRELAFGFYNGGLQGYLTMGVNLQTDRWYHLAGTWAPEGTAHRMRLYVDGVQRATATTSSAMLTNTQALYIGRDSSGYYWSGILDDLRVYSRALSADEVMQVKNETL